MEIIFMLPPHKNWLSAQSAQFEAVLGWVPICEQHINIIMDEIFKELQVQVISQFEVKLLVLYGRRRLKDSWGPEGEVE